MRFDIIIRVSGIVILNYTKNKDLGNIFNKIFNKTIKNKI